MRFKTNGQLCRLCTIALLAVFAQYSEAQTSLPTSTPTPTKDFFSPLEDIRPKAKGVSNQNFTRCCLIALKQWRDDPNSRKDIIVQSSKNTSKIFTDKNDLLANGASEQFPCGAEYEHDEDGAMRVKISYPWCKANCGGWQRSRSAVLEQWVQPFVGFILPAAVFCLNVSLPLSRCDCYIC